MKPQILSTLRSERTAKSAQCCGNRLVAQTGEEFPSGAEWPVRRAIFAREMVRVNLHAFCAFERLGDTPVFGYVLAGRPEVELSFCARQLCYSRFAVVAAVFDPGIETKWSTARSTRPEEAVTLVVNWPLSVVP